MELCCSAWELAFSFSRLSALFPCRVRVLDPFFPDKTNEPTLEVENPKMVLIVGAVGFGLNIISMLFLHGESSFKYPEEFSRLIVGADHGHGHDHGHSHGHSHSQDHSHSHSHDEAGENSDSIRMEDEKVSLIYSRRLGRS